MRNQRSVRALFFQDARLGAGDGSGRATEMNPGFDDCYGEGGVGEWPRVSRALPGMLLLLRRMRNINCKAKFKRFLVGEEADLGPCHAEMMLPSSMLKYGSARWV